MVNAVLDLILKPFSLGKSKTQPITPEPLYETSYDIPPGRNSERIERRTSNIERPTSNVEY